MATSSRVNSRTVWLDGEVIIHYANGNRFKGVYHKGKREGPCIEEDKDGKRFEGTYRNDVRDGSL